MSVMEWIKCMGRIVMKNIHEAKLLKNKNVIVGKHTYGLFDSTIPYTQQKVEIGSYCSFADGVRILSWGEHRLDLPSTYPIKTKMTQPKNNVDGFSKGPIIIGNDVWIGTNAIILSNVKIGDGTVIAAGAVVTQDIPPYAIVGGVPAKVIKYRFSKGIIENLERIRWWEWPDEEVKRNVDLFYGSIEDFVEKAEIISKKNGIS